MKTKSLLIAKLVEGSFRLAPLAIAVAAALMTAQPVFGVPDHQLILTENSSSSLSVTYDGSGAGITIINNAPDFWTMFFPQNINLSGGGHWQEPENPDYVNSFSGISNIAQVRSDEFVGPNNGYPSDGYTYIGVGVDTSDSRFIDATFYDLGDTVPDAGSTFVLLFLSFFALMGATRVVPFRQREMVRIVR